VVTNPLEAVALKIVERYSHPGRTAYMYLFRVTPESDFTALIPSASDVIAVWMDEGNNLEQSPIDTTIAHSTVTRNAAPTLTAPQKLTSTQRRQMMARVVVFSVSQLNDDEVEVHLVSRPLIFTPKGDREVTEKWRRSADGWYSAYQPD
jgi:hypothetical protein